MSCAKCLGAGHHLGDQRLFQTETLSTLGFPKKLQNRLAAVALYFAWYNFCRIHGSLRVTPAMAAGVSKVVWELERLIL